MKILDGTIHSLKISNSQNQTSHHLTKELVGESNSFILNSNGKKKNIKNDKLPEGPKAPQKPNGPGARSYKKTLHSFREAQKKITYITENASSDRRQNLITPKTYAETRWRGNSPVEKFEFKN
ncbi:hypothetical protein AVEN_152903-1 [Araneus ventricosus]|uniref:Uncharacterized protein n=1 Tax=Araneus ventricosus TaxID=182803 RepID=A0A4Y2AD42_ARAVE|nr:hypothetical protein AVEN_152903-1 [Araneus ventricosus]